MRTIRCAFTDFWEDFIPEISFPLLFENYKVIPDTENPDYLFYSSFGGRHHAYPDCIKIFWTAENEEPDFNDCDYAISRSEISYAGRSFRPTVPDLYLKLERIPALSREELLDRKFCNFIYTNNSWADPYRIRFFEALSKYKKVDSGGRLLNNMGMCVPPGMDDKVLFQSRYKFSIAIENSSMPGYTTEKIYHPFMARSLPFYWGNPHISSDYNPNSFVNLMNYSSMEEAVEEIIRLDNDDEAYLEKVTAPFWPYGYSFEDYRQQERERMLHFFESIFSQPLEQAFRRTRHGRQKIYRIKQMERFTPLYKRAGIKVRNLIKNKYLNCVNVNKTKRGGGGGKCLLFKEICRLIYFFVLRIACVLE